MTASVFIARSWLRVVAAPAPLDDAASASQGAGAAGTASFARSLVASPLRPPQASPRSGYVRSVPLASAPVYGRPMRLPRVLIGVLVFAGCLALAAVALAGSALDVTMAKRAEGPYRSSTPMVTIASPKDLYVRIKNVAATKQAIRVVDARGGDDVDDFKIRWYRGRKDITAAARGDGDEFNLRSGDARRLRAHVKPVVANPGAACVAITAFATPNGDIEGGSFQVNGDNQCG